MTTHNTGSTLPPATPVVTSTPCGPHSHGRRRLFLRRFSPGRLDDP